MAYGRLILGALVGAVVGAAVWVAVQFFVEREFAWLAIGVGLLAGLFAKSFVGRARVSYARGAVPLLATVLCIYLVNPALYSLRQATGGPRSHAPLVDGDLDSSSASGSAERAASGDSAASVELMRGSLPGGGTQGLRRAKDPFPLGMFLWIGVAALVAYVLAGSDPPKEVEVPEEESSETPPADGSSEPAAEPPAAEQES